MHFSLLRESLFLQVTSWFGSNCLEETHPSFDTLLFQFKNELQEQISRGSKLLNNVLWGGKKTTKLSSCLFRDPGVSGTKGKVNIAVCDATGNRKRFLLRSLSKIPRASETPASVPQGGADCLALKRTV